MQTEINKEDLIALIKGVTGYESHLFASELEKEGWGELTGYPNEKWYWNDRAFQVRSESQLLEFYTRLKNIAREETDRYNKKYKMTKIEQIQGAIFHAEQRQSKLTPLALSVPALSSLNIRHLMNNLGAISTKYGEHGIHKGGLFCSTIFKNDNLKVVTAIDNWESDNTNEDKAEPQFRENVLITKPINTGCVIIKSNSFDIPPSLMGEDIDLYLFDADHSEDSQCRALTHFLPAMADQFIFCVDDWDFPEVEAGTLRGLKETGVEVLFCQIFKGNDHDNEGFYNGFAVFLLKKKA